MLPRGRSLRTRTAVILMSAVSAIAFAALAVRLGPHAPGGCGRSADSSWYEKQLDKRKESLKFDEWREKLPGKKVESLEFSTSDFAPYAVTLEDISFTKDDRRYTLLDERRRKLGSVDINLFKSSAEARKCLLVGSHQIFAPLAFGLPKKGSKYEIGDVSLCGTRIGPRDELADKPVLAIMFIRNNVWACVTYDDTSKVVEMAKAIDDRLVAALVDDTGE